MKHRFGATSPKRKMVIFGSVLIYALLLSILLFVVWKDAALESETVFGSLEGRFLSDVVMLHNDETYYYRENEITNYLIIGLDRENINTESGYQNGGQADFLVILSIDRINRTITPIMLDRDTMTPVQTFGIFGHPSGTRVMQLCLAQAYSGVGSTGSNNTVNAVEELLYGVKIDRYITIDISAVPLVNDAIGGVEVTLEDDFTVFDPAMSKGATIRLNGQQAAYFVRGRMTVSDGTNASRMRRQQQYISNFLTQLGQQSETDAELPTRLMDVVSDHIQSDVSPETLLRDISMYEDYLWLPILTPEGSYTIDEFGFAEFWVNDEELQELILELWFVKEEH